MPNRSLSHLADEVLLRDLAALVRKDRTTTAELLAHIAEVDARAIYATRGCASMQHYCVQALGLSPDVASKRIQAARQTSADIKTLLAHRACGLGADAGSLALGAAMAGGTDAANVTEQSPQQDLNPIPASCRSGEVVPVMVPLSSSAPTAVSAPVRFPLNAAVTQATRDKPAYTRELLGHAVPDGDIAEVLDRALDALIEKIERRRFGVGARTQPARRSAPRRAPANERSIPMAVRQAVFRRDGGRCTFVGDTGQRCDSCHSLEFDHVVPIARGGLTTADNLRLRCRTHNRLEAERSFGAAFMRAKRERASAARVAPPEPGWHRDVLAALRGLGFREKEARAALPACELSPDVSLEQRVRAALRYLAPPASRHPAPAA